MDQQVRKSLSFQEKLSSGADRMARRMGGHFVKDDRWASVVSASERSQVNRTAK